ncbi:dynein axonemal assembly factor 1-like isoform X2 [Daktulosphaira vitifoliae]|nr:dynein axonemal assembly factor 1-like isoform X2 [Daktulosphaira vitifoliae]
MKIENLDCLQKLNTINLSYNFIRKIENLSILPGLSSLFISHNKLSTADDISHLTECKCLSIVDLSHNSLDDPEIVEIFSKMECLKVLTLTGNGAIPKIKNYRKTLILKCKDLRHLDDRPVFFKDRACAEAWSEGGIEAEQAMRIKLNQEEQQRINDSVEALIKLRDIGHQSKNLTSKTLDQSAGDNITVNNLISSEEFYKNYEEESSDSSDESSENSFCKGPLVQEVCSESEVNESLEEKDCTANDLCHTIVNSLVDKCYDNKLTKISNDISIDKTSQQKSEKRLNLTDKHEETLILDQCKIAISDKNDTVVDCNRIENNNECCSIDKLTLRELSDYSCTESSMDICCNKTEQDDSEFGQVEHNIENETAPVNCISNLFHASKSSQIEEMLVKLPWKNSQNETDFIKLSMKQSHDTDDKIEQETRKIRPLIQEL